MKFLFVLHFFCLLSVIFGSGNSDDHKKKLYHEKSHQNKQEKEKFHITKPEKTETREHVGSHFIHYGYRVGNRHCEMVCTEGGSPSNASDIQIYYNGASVLIGYLKESANVSVLYEYSSNITVILNGQSGRAIVGDNNKQKFYVIEKSTETASVIWLASRSDYSAYFKNLSSLQNFVKVGEEKGKSINSEEVAKVETSDLSLLGLASSNLTITKETLAELNVIKFFYKGQGSFTVHKGIKWFRSVSLAFADILRPNEKELQSADIKLDLNSIFEANSGIEALLNLLSQIGRNIDLAKLLQNQLRSPEKLLELLERISGGSNEGLDGIITIVITVIRAVNGHCSVNEVINAILSYNNDENGESSSISRVINQALEIIESQNRIFQNGAAFQQITTVLKALSNGNLFYNNVNISDIITLLTSRNPRTMIQVIIRIISRFVGTPSFIRFIQSFFDNLNSTQGLAFITHLFPGIDINRIRELLSNGSFLQTLRNAFSHLTNSTDISSLLSHIPVFGNIFQHFPNFTSGFNVSGYVNGNSAGGTIDNFRNVSSGIASGVENAVHHFVGGIFGEGTVNRSSPSPTTASPLISHITETAGSSRWDNSSPPIFASATSSNNETTKDGKAKTESAGKDGSPTTPNSTYAIHYTRDSVVTRNESTVAGSSTDKPPILRHHGIQKLHEKKEPHHGHHESIRKESLHAKNNLQEKDSHHQHSHASNRNENSHAHQTLQEKNTHHEHLHGSNRKEKTHETHKFENRDNHHNHFQERHENNHMKHRSQENGKVVKNHNEATEEKKHGNHFDHHN